jgi:hypothetical protein
MRTELFPLMELVSAAQGVLADAGPPLVLINGCLFASAVLFAVAIVWGGIWIARRATRKSRSVDEADDEGSPVE